MNGTTEHKVEPTKDLSDILQDLHDAMYEKYGMHVRVSVWNETDLNKEQIEKAAEGIRKDLGGTVHTFSVHTLCVNGFADFNLLEEQEQTKEVRKVG